MTRRTFPLMAAMAALLLLAGGLAACTPPGTRTCDGNTTQVCLNGSYVNDTVCPYGCLSGECKPQPPPPRNCPQWADEFVESVRNVTQRSEGSVRNCTITTFTRYCINAARKVNASWAERRNESECRPWVEIYAPCAYRLNASERKVESEGGQCRVCTLSTYTWFCAWNRSYDNRRVNETRSCGPWMACDRIPMENPSKPTGPSGPAYAQPPTPPPTQDDAVMRFINANAGLVAVAFLVVVFGAVAVAMLMGGRGEE